jgi:hypothetical protein
VVVIVKKVTTSATNTTTTTLTTKKTRRLCLTKRIIKSKVTLPPLPSVWLRLNPYLKGQAVKF